MRKVKTKAIDLVDSNMKTLDDLIGNVISASQVPGRSAEGLWEEVLETMALNEKLNLFSPKNEIQLIERLDDRTQS